MLSKNDLSEKLMRKLYIDEKMSIIKISDLVGASYKAVRLRLKELNILRNKSEAAIGTIKSPISEEGKRNKSISKTKQWSDPNSVYNSPEFRLNKSISSAKSRKETLSNSENLNKWLKAIHKNKV